ncbi:hypothetical protein [Allorhizobium undicola]|uniref:hypothetical protein n=1 Tax=Allorhizobium undicola TaxID=78527 RepID=UPI0004826EC7|nr:hypothetical protein [Allorhizobium undicola]
MSKRFPAIANQLSWPRRSSAETFLTDRQFIAGVSIGLTVLSKDLKLTGGLREFVNWGGNPVGGVTTQQAYFGSVEEICQAQSIYKQKALKA